MRKSDYPKVLRRGVAGMVILLLLFGAFAPATMAGVWPRCNDVCRASDFTITDAWVVADPNCTPGQDTTAKLWVNFWSNRAADTYCIVSVVDVWAGTDKIYDDLTNDSIGDISGKGNFPRMLSEITWTCGKELKLDDIYVQWMVSSSTPCPGKCKNGGNNYPPGQCWMGGPIYVRAPLIANFTFDNVCFCTYTTFTDTTTGGSGSYTTYDWDFGDETTHSTDQNPTHHYAIAKEYTVTLTVTDSDSNSDSQSYDVEVYANPVADFTATPTSCCTPLTVTFTDASSSGTPNGGAITSWSWDFDNDGTPDSTVQNPSYQYSTSGTYTVNLTVTDSHGCTDYEVKSDYITANEGPTADFSATPTSCCAPLTVQFTDASTAGDNPITGWSWDFDNDGIPDSTVQNPSYQYFTSGTYTVNLTVTDSHGCTDYEVKSDYITANEGPTADFSATPTSCCAPLTVQFTDASTAGDNPITGWSWDFDNDGIPDSTVQNPSYQYSTSGTYTVNLTVTDSHGCTDYEVKSDYITANEGPTADFSATPTSCCAPLTVQFTDASTAGDNPITGWSWDFDNDGIPDSTVQNPSYQYSTSGTYTVNLTVTDSHGCTDYEVKSDYITANEGPTADFSATPTSCCAPLTVQFTDASTAGDNPITGWSWDFDNDGIPDSTVQNPSYQYFTSGTYTVNLTVTDSHGCMDYEVKSDYITANEGPTADFSATPTSCCAPLTVQFTDASTAGDNPITGWSWDFDNDGIPDSTVQNPSYQYFTSGTYTVNLTVTDSHGCTDYEVKSDYITANEGPTADFSATPTSCCAPLTVQFTDASTAGDNPITGWSWDFDNDGIPDSTVQNPSYQYSTSGTYTVNLTVTDSHGCTDYEVKSDYITANEGPTADFSATPTSCCAPLTVQFTDASTAGDNPITGWSWDFDNDGIPDSTVQNPSYQYSTSGTYTVNLTVTDSHGCTDYEVKSDYITANEGPTADFSATPTSCCAPLTVQFTDASTAGDNPITGWSWDFDNDGIPDSTVQNPSYQYSTSGTYTVNLTVTDSHGCTDYEVKSDYITANENPTATASSNSPVCEGNPLTLTGGPDGMTTYSWTGPVGFSSSVQSPTVSTSATLAMAGDYILTVTDAHGCTDSASTTVVVYSKPTATASSNSPVCEGNPLTLTGGPDGMTTYSWTGPVGFSSSVQSPTVSTSATLAMAGDYILTVTDAHGCTDSASTTVVVYSKPTATASSNSPVCEGNPLTLTGGPDGMTTYSWTGPVGFSSSVQSPTVSTSATLAMAGDYILTVTDAHGCTDSASTTVVVNTKPTADAGPDKSISTGGSVVIGGSPTASGGAPPYIYSWTPATGLNDHTIANPTASPTSTTTYTVTVTDANGCVDRDDVVVTVTYSISGIKFNDLNGNEVKDAGEPALSGWTINLAGPVSGTTTTAAADGSYIFTNLVPGTYTVSEVLKPGWAQTCPTAPGTYSVTLTDSPVIDRDFGNRGDLSISGMKFNDLNGNGVKDAGEPGLSGWTINLAGLVSGTTTTAAADGSYTFTNLVPGTYTVSEVLKPGWAQTCPTAPGTYSVTLTDSPVIDRDFGNRGDLSISGMKFNDLNGNGVKDAGEPALSGWTINLAGLVSGTTTTAAADGSYTFTNLVPGTYTVSEVLKPGWAQTCPTAPGTYSVTLTDSPVIDRDFGNRGDLSISGMKFNDLNGNGVKDAGEPALSGWTINLAGLVSGTTTTAAADGSYIFTNLVPGTYTVSEVLKPGWAQTCPTAPGTYSVTLTDSPVIDRDFGNRGDLSISGMKFNDLNGNGVKDAGEPALSGWTINLAGPVSGTTTTAAADGSYIFTNLVPGTYTVSEVLKPGWAQTCPTAPGTYSVTLTDSPVIDRDFGNRGALSISGMKFNDLNGDGVKDPGEPGLSGWRIYNDSNNNGVFDPGELNVTTGAGGAYSFDNLEPGTYKICEVVKDGWTQTTSPTCYDITLTDTSVTDKDFGNRGALSISLEKISWPAIVAPGGNVTYTINYTNTGTVPLHDVVITEYYPKGVTFISASPAPDAGTNNVWTIGTLGPGESGTIVIKVKVPEEVDLSFTETGSVIGEGLVMVTKDLSTEQKPYSLRNRVTLSCNELAPVSAYATTKVSGVPGTSLGITESGSGVYSSDEILDLETKNKTIILKKTTHAEYKPTSFNFSDSFSVDFTNKWKQDICSKNMEIDAAIHKKISDATYIDDETISRVDKDKSTMSFDSSFNGSLHIGARTKDTAISETYIGEFDVLQTIQIAKGPIPTPAPTPTPTPIWLPCPYNDTPELNTTEDAEPTP